MPLSHLVLLYPECEPPALVIRGLGWFVVVLLPVSGVVQIGEMARADRYTYVALVGIFLLCTEQVSEWLTAPSGNRQRRAVSVASATVVILGIFMLVSHDYTKKWHDGISIFRHALAVTSDNYIAEANLGSALFSAGLKEEGMAHYRESIRIHAPALEHHRRAALEAENRRDWPAAIYHYGKIITLIPWNAEIHQQLGVVLMQNGDYAKALVQYNEALRYDRGAIPPRLGVARALIAQQRFPEARDLLTSVVRLHTDNEEAATLLRALPPGALTR